MVIHELATNAVKHGALSAPEGRIVLTWRLVAGQRLEILWEEHDGPKIGVPAHSGFGSKLIQQTVRHELSGTVESIFAPDGLHCTIGLPLL